MPITKEHVDLLNEADAAEIAAAQQKQAADAAAAVAVQKRQSAFTTIGAEMAKGEIRVFSPTPIKALYKEGDTPDTVKIIELPNLPVQ